MKLALDGPLYKSKASSELVAEFEKKAIKVVCSDHEILFRRDDAGDSVYLVLAGQVRLLLPLSTTDGMEFLARPGVAALDYAVVYGCVRLAEKLMKREQGTVAPQ